MRSLRIRLGRALVVSIAATAVSLPVTASADLTIDLPLLPPITVPGPNLGCGSGNGNEDNCPTTTTTTVPATTTTVPATTTTVPATEPDPNLGCGNGNGNGNDCPPIVSPTVTVTVPATTVPVTATTQAATQVTMAGTTASTSTTAATTSPETRLEPGQPPAVTPRPGLSGFNTALMAPQMAGAVEMLKNRDDGATDIESEPELSSGMMSEGLNDLLSPVLPPGLVDAVVSPLVILDALYEAFTSSGQALIVPGIAFLFGFGMPGLRRRITLDET
jgi:hypothetical protein